MRLSSLSYFTLDFFLIQFRSLFQYLNTSVRPIRTLFILLYLFVLLFQFNKSAFPVLCKLLSNKITPT